MDAVLRPSPLHAEPDAANGGVIVDDSGRAVLLRGVNVNALAEYWKAGEFATTFPLIDSALFVAFYPASKHGAPRVTASELDRVRALIAPGGNAYLIGESRGGEWSVSVASSSP